MQVYKKKAVILDAFNKMDNKSWEKKEQARFENNLYKLNLSIDQLNKYGFQITLLMLISFEKNKPITTIQEAQIVGCSQALVAKLHRKLCLAKVLEIISNPRCKKTSKAMRYVIRVIWTRLGELTNLNIRNLNELIKCISLYSNEKKEANKSFSDGLREIRPEDYGQLPFATKIIDY